MLILILGHQKQFVAVWKDARTAASLGIFIHENLSFLPLVHSEVSSKEIELAGMHVLSQRIGSILGSRATFGDSVVPDTGSHRLSECTSSS